MHSAQSVYSALAAFSLLLFFASESVVIANAVAKVQINPVVIRELQRSHNTGECSSVEDRERARSEISQAVKAIIAANSTVCNGTPGWRRVAFINMTDTSYNCPTGLNLTSYSKRTCGRAHTTNGYDCSSTAFSVGGLSYSQVCGRIRGYQFGGTGAFISGRLGVDDVYVQGVSLTHGVNGSRQHVWTFAAGLSEVNTSYRYELCPCDAASSNMVPSFVKDDYFCESGLQSGWSRNYTLYPDDVLWDGEDCISTSTCCQFNSPPWFTKNLPSETTDDIELRLCTSSTPLYVDVPIELIELYVQ